MSFTDTWAVSAGDTPPASKWDELGLNDDWLKAAVTTGWIDASDHAWSYASANSVTVPFDLTGRITIGMPVRITQAATVKYFYVVGIAFSAGSTTIKLFAGTDYVVANSAISAQGYSIVDCPAGFPKYFICANTTWVLTGGTTGASANTGAVFYMRGQELTFKSGFQINVTAGSTSRATCSFDATLLALLLVGVDNNHVLANIRTRNPVGTVASYGGSVAEWDPSGTQFVAQVGLSTVTSELTLVAKMIIS